MTSSSQLTSRTMPAPRRSNHAEHYRSRLLLVVQASFLSLLCACTTPSSDKAQQNLLRHPIALSERSETVKLSIDGNNFALTSAVDRLGPKNLYVDLYVSPQTETRHIELLIRQLHGLGVAHDAIRKLPGATLQFDAVLRKEQAIAQGCPAADAGVWKSNQPHSNGFGCSVNGNLAAQIAKPRQINQPEPLGQPNPITTVGAVDAYQRGETAPLKAQGVSGGQKN